MNYNITIFIECLQVSINDLIVKLLKCITSNLVLDMFVFFFLLYWLEQTNIRSQMEKSQVFDNRISACTLMRIFPVKVTIYIKYKYIYLYKKIAKLVYTEKKAFVIL